MCSEQAEGDGNGNREAVPNQKSPPGMKARARAAHNAAGISPGFTWSRNQLSQYERTKDDEERGYKKAKIVALGKQAAITSVSGLRRARVIQLPCMKSPMLRKEENPR